MSGGKLVRWISMSARSGPPDDPSRIMHRRSRDEIGSDIAIDLVSIPCCGTWVPSRYYFAPFSHASRCTEQTLLTRSTPRNQLVRLFASLDPSRGATVRTPSSPLRQAVQIGPPPARPAGDRIEYL